MEKIMEFFYKIGRIIREKLFRKTIYYNYHPNQITPEMDTILVSLGGLSASSYQLGRPTDKISILARDILKNNTNLIRIWGKARLSTDPAALASRIQAYITAMRNNNRTAKIILIGKSLGGHKLCEASSLFPDTIRLFIGVDVSGSISRHHLDFIESNGERGAKWLKSTIQKLYGFYQINSSLQTGAPLLYTKSRGHDFQQNIPPICDGAYNIDVNNTKIDHTSCIPDTSGSIIVQEAANHMNIDSKEELLSVIRNLINKEIPS